VWLSLGWPWRFALAAPRLLAAESEEDVEAFAKWITAETELRSGRVSPSGDLPGQSGETFLIQGREGAGYWLQVVLPDGRIAYVLGDTVETVRGRTRCARRRGHARLLRATPRCRRPMAASP